MLNSYLLLVIGQISLLWSAGTTGFVPSIKPEIVKHSALSSYEKYLKKTNVGIIDTPIDFENNDELQSKSHINSCFFHEDSSGVICDLLDNRNDKEYFNSVEVADVMSYLKLQKKFELTATEKTWLEDKTLDKKFLAKVSRYISSSHGTHVAGIVAQDNSRVNILEMAAIPLKKGTVAGAKNTDEPLRQVTSADLFKLQFLIDKEIAQKMLLHQNMANFITENKIELINGSYGQNSCEDFILRSTLNLGLMPDPVHSKYLARYYRTMFNKKMKKLIDQNENTLFIYAAGNAGENNDMTPQVPATINSDQVIAVAAVDQEGNLASFSNYGPMTVDLAAPGVNINSKAIGGYNLDMNGTSQAAPQVTRTASIIRSINSKLSAKEVKEIITKTVDQIGRAHV